MLHLVRTVCVQWLQHGVGEGGVVVVANGKPAKYSKQSPVFIVAKIVIKSGECLDAARHQP